MFSKFYPSMYVDSAYKIDYENMYKKGLRGIIFDVDNTLVPHGAPATEEAVLLFKKLHEMGIDTCIISNNKEPRVAPFANLVGSEYILRPESLKKQIILKQWR